MALLFFCSEGTNWFDVLTELEVRIAIYGPEIDQSQHAKLVSYINNKVMANKFCVL